MEARAKRRKRIALIYGGIGGEREVSASGAKNVLGLIDKEEYIPYPVEISQSGEWLHTAKNEEQYPIYPARINGRSGFIDKERFLPCKIAFPLLHGEMGEDGKVQGLLDCLDFSYVGCGVFAGAVAYDKACTKIFAERLGIPTVKWIATDGEQTAESALLLAEKSIGYPMFIKPTAQGSSIGAKGVLSREDFIPAFLAARSAGNGRVLIEELLEDKRELECAYLCAGGTELVTPPGEVLCRGFYGYGEKYLGKGEIKITPVAAVSEATQSILTEYCLILAKALGIRHLSRFDFFLTPEGLYLNEINTMPGFTAGSLYSAMTEAAGIDKKRLINLLIKAALEDDRRP